MSRARYFRNYILKYSLLFYFYFFETNKKLIAYVFRSHITITLSMSTKHLCVSQGPLNSVTGHVVHTTWFHSIFFLFSLLYRLLLTVAVQLKYSTYSHICYLTAFIRSKFHWQTLYRTRQLWDGSALKVTFGFPSLNHSPTYVVCR